MTPAGVPLTQRVLAVTLLVTLAASAYYSVAVPLRTYYERRGDMLATGRERLGRLQRIAAAKGELTAALAVVEASDPGAELLWAGETPAVAAADLQERIKALVAEHGGNLLSTSTQAPSAEADLTRIGVTARLTIGNEGMRGWLHGLEAGSPVAFIDKLTIRTQARAGQTGPAEDPLLYIDASISGYTRAPLAEMVRP